MPEIDCIVEKNGKTYVKIENQILIFIVIFMIGLIIGVILWKRKTEKKI